jgi:hypothetical protein
MVSFSIGRTPADWRRGAPGSPLALLGKEIIKSHFRFAMDSGNRLGWRRDIPRLQTCLEPELAKTTPATG